MTWLTDEMVERAAKHGETLPIEENDADPDGLMEERLREIDDAEYVVLTDCSDADGLGCAAMYRHKWGDDVTILPAGYGSWGPDPHTAFARIGVAVPDEVPVYVTDLGQNKSDQEKWLKAVSQLAATNPVYFRDHHDTPEDLLMSLSGLANVDYVHDAEQCATSIVLQEDYPDAPKHLHELAKYTNVRDLYLTDRPEFEEGEVLTNAAFWLPFEEYVTAAAEFGMDIDQHPEFGEIVEKRRELKERKLDWVMETAEFHTIQGYEVAFVYGECYHSEAGRRLIEEQGADIAAIIKPSGKVSWRSDEDVPLAKDLAEELGGGGHPCAAGCKPFGGVNIDNESEKDSLAETEKEHLTQTAESVLG